MQPPTASPEIPAGRPVRWAAIVGFGAVALAALAWFDPATSPLALPCLFHGLTGLHCPGCGGQRAVHALLHGDLATAISQNALLILAVLPAAAWYSLQALFRRTRGLDQLIPAFTVPRLLFLAALVLVFALLRNLPFAPLHFLAP